LRRSAFVRRRLALRLVAAFAAAGLVSLSQAAPGDAGTATFDGTVVRYVAASGEANHVLAQMGDICFPYTDLGACGPAVLLRERGAAPLLAGQGCRPLGPQWVICSIGAAWQPGANEEQLVHLVLADGDDSADTTLACASEDVLPICAALVDGGDGNDTLRGAKAGVALDRLAGGAGRDNLRGGYELEGGPGADTLRGYFDVDREDVSRAVYRDRRARVFVTLNGRRDDGERSENDLVIDVAGAEGGANADVLVGNRRSNIFYGGRGRDVIRTRGGTDRAYGDDFRSLVRPFCHPRIGGADRLYGGAGRDRLRGCAGADLLNGGPGPDYVDGQRGSDFITGGRGRDRLHGSVGSDTLFARDGDADWVFGGRGRDRGRIDRGVDARRSIERLLR
jgi:Ca2+-binding RTX toxin-like protein